MYFGFKMEITKRKQNPFGFLILILFVKGNTTKRWHCGSVTQVLLMSVQLCSAI